MNCKSCQCACVSALCKSQRNLGRAYWACPNQCKVFNGFLDTINKQTTTCAGGLPKCKACEACCVIRTSQSEKNPGRQYFACLKCTAFNGFVIATLHDKSIKTNASPVFQERKCQTCATMCFIHVTRFLDKLTEVYYKCPNCNLHNGAVEQQVPMRKASKKKNVARGTDDAAVD